MKKFVLILLLLVLGGTSVPLYASFEDEYIDTDCATLLNVQNIKSYNEMSSFKLLSYNFEENSEYPKKISIKYSPDFSMALAEIGLSNADGSCTLLKRYCPKDSNTGSIICDFTIPAGKTVISFIPGSYLYVDHYIPINRLVLPKFSLNDIKRDGDAVVISGTTQKALEYLEKVEALNFECTVEKDEENSKFLKYIQKFECKANTNVIWPDGKFEDKEIKFTFFPVYDKVEMYKTITIPKNLQCPNNTIFNEAAIECQCPSVHYKFIDDKCVPPECENGTWDAIKAKCVSESECDEEAGFFWDETTKSCISKLPDFEKTDTKKFDPDSEKDKMNLPGISSNAPGCSLSNLNISGQFLYLISLLFGIRFRKSK